MISLDFFRFLTYVLMFGEKCNEGVGGIIWPAVVILALMWQSTMFPGAHVAINDVSWRPCGVAK